MWKKKNVYPIFYHVQYSSLGIQGKKKPSELNKSLLVTKRKQEQLFTPFNTSWSYGISFDQKQLTSNRDIKTSMTLSESHRHFNFKCNSGDYTSTASDI